MRLSGLTQIKFYGSGNRRSKLVDLLPIRRLDGLNQACKQSGATG